MFLLPLPVISTVSVFLLLAAKTEIIPITWNTILIIPRAKSSLLALSSILPKLAAVDFLSRKLISESEISSIKRSTFVRSPSSARSRICSKVVEFTSSLDNPTMVPPPIPVPPRWVILSRFASIMEVPVPIFEITTQSLPDKYIPPRPIAVISSIFVVGIPKISFFIFTDPAPVIIIFSTDFISILLSETILPSAPVADVIASNALVLTVLTTLPLSTATALVVVLPISIPIIIFR